MIFFLEYAGELRIIALRRKKVKIAIQQPTDPDPHTRGLSLHARCAWVNKNMTTTLDLLPSRTKGDQQG